jgi:hypothetical protein
MMPPITIVDGLPFVSVVVSANGQTISIQRVLLDTGSASTIFRTDDMETIGLVWQLTDEVSFVRGIGGRESVVEKQIDFVEIGDLRAAPMAIEMGAVDYGFLINGIVGLDFLLKADAGIDLPKLEVRKGAA